MRSKKVVIAGAGGYLASNFLPLLADAEGISLYALSSRTSTYFSNKVSNKVKHFKLDMNDYGKAKETIGDGCDVAINFSWIGARDEKRNEDDIQKANEDNSLNLLCSLINAGCSRFIQIGSIAEYGIVDGVITESSECNPITVYAKRKLSCANRMKDLCDMEGIEFIEFRMGSMYGNYMKQENILGYLCRKFSQRKYVTLKTSCTQDWEYTHVDDFNEILLKAIFSDALSGIYNITNGETHKLKYFIQIIEEKYGLSNHIEFGNIDQGIGCQNIRCDISKIHKFFGKTHFVSFKEGIDSVVTAI